MGVEILVDGITTGAGATGAKDGTGAAVLGARDVGLKTYQQ